MRILSLRFKNLNSLEGEWSIDFAHGAYEADGLFAITGPTGSGKTTVLDAICLGLYGMTPRLKSITKGFNEIMSRDTGECFAEVVFATSEGIFRSHWSQHRARKSPKGALQAPKHELSQIDGKIIEDKPSKVIGAVQKKLGMDFEQFTRSVMLAQGGFAAFLNAPPGNRAPILEQITGTKIYSDISVAVHERKVEEQSRLDELRAQAQSIALLSPEELEEVKDSLDQYTKKDQELAQSIKVLQDIIDHKKKEEELLKKNAQDTKELEEIRLLLKEKELALRDCESEVSERQINLQEAKEHQKKMEPVISKAMELDNEIKALSTQKASLHQKNRELHGEIKAIKSRQDELSGKIKESEHMLERANKYLESHAEDSRLATSLPALEKTFDDISRTISKSEHIQQQLHETRRKLKELTENIHALQADQGSISKAMAEAEKTNDELAEKISSTLENKDVSYWFSLIEDASDRINKLEKIHDFLQQIDESASGEKSLEEQMESLRSSLSESQGSVDQDEKDLAACAREVELLQSNLDFEKRVRDLEEQRKELIQGKPCPLCGSTQHPYADSSPATPSETEKKLKDAQERKGNLESRLQDSSIKKAELQAEMKQVQSRLDNRRSQINQLYTRLHEALGKLGLNPQEKKLWEEVSNLLSAEKDELERFRKITKKAQGLQKKKDKAAGQLQKIQKKLTAAENKLQEAQKEKEIVEAAQKHQESQDQEQAQELESRRRQAMVELVKFGITDLPLDDLNSTFHILTKRKKSWEDRNNEKLLLEKKLIEQEGEIKTNLARTESLQRQLDEQEKEMKTQDLQLETLSAQRKALLPDADPKGLREELTKEMESAQVALDKTIEKKHEEEKAKATLYEKEKAREKSLKKRAEDLDALQKDLWLKLKDAGLDKISQDRLQENLDLAHASLREVQQKIGASKERLEKNAKMEQEQNEKLILIQDQEKELDRWRRLHELIGSADGKKFRTFAQGLTFEILVSNANSQLSKMTDRYLLIPDKDKPLEFMVTDAYQGGQLRSTKNLSGGESFLVSLALALGLANMASKNIQVDSLFLDEGFGTLDDDALDMALDTLSGLQQDGKLVGIISHVAAIRERISTRLEAIPLSGGRSKLTGPGCKHL